MTININSRSNKDEILSHAAELADAYGVVKEQQQALVILLVLVFSLGILF
jgi:hypothetical protein